MMPYDVVALVQDVLAAVGIAAVAVGIGSWLVTCFCREGAR